MRRWDPLQEQDNRQQRRIAAAGPPAPSTADVAGFEDYPCFYVKLRHGRVLDSAGSFEEVMRSARRGWAAGTTVTATHLAPDRHPVLLLEAAVGAGCGAEYGAGCGATRWVADVPGSATAGLTGALRTLNAFDALPELSIQRGGVIGSTAARTQAAWLGGETGAGVDTLRTCPFTSQQQQRAQQQRAQPQNRPPRQMRTQRRGRRTGLPLLQLTLVGRGDQAA